MKVTTGVNAGGTCLQGYLEDVSFWELVDIFGEPEGPSGDGKTRVNWSIKFEQEIDELDLNGTITNTVTIYDWKTDEPINEVRKWNVGGNDIVDYNVLKAYVEKQREQQNQKMGDMKFTTAGDVIDQQNKFTQQQWDRTVGYGKVPEEYAKKEYVYPGSDPQE